MSHPDPSHAPPPAFDPYRVPLVPGVTLVEASAGTGKTTALTALVARLAVDPDAGVLDDGAGWPDLRRALVVTFTRAATAELVTRIRRTLRHAIAAFQEGADPAEASASVRPLLDHWGQSPAERAHARSRLTAALGSGEASVFTIDGFCKRVLERSAFESGEPFAFSVADSDAELRGRALAETWQARVREFPALAAVSVAGGVPWTLGRLAEGLTDATRHPGTRLLPEPEPLADAVAAYAEAVAGLARVWDEGGARAAYADAPKTKDAPSDPAALFARLGAFVARNGEAHVDAALACTADALAAGVHKGSKAGKEAAERVRGHDAFRACTDVAVAAERVRLALFADLVTSTDVARRRLGARAGVLTFTDLLDRVHDALHHGRIGPQLGRAIRGQYRLALVDEFQDTDARQEAVFRRAFEGAPLVLVGDPKQAIYAFRGADVFAYLGARAHAGQTYALGRNYRSAPALVGAVNALFGRGERPFVHGGIPFAPAEAAVDAPRIRGVGGAPFVWWSAAHLPQGKTGVVTKDVATPAILNAVVAEARRLLDDPDAQVLDVGPDGTERWRRLRAADIAVLVRTNDQTAQVQNALRRAGLPSVVGKGGDVRHSREMADLEHVLRAVDAPGDRTAVRTALATELWGWTADRIADLDEPGWAEVTDRLRATRAVWHRRGVFEAVVHFVEAEGVEARLLAHADGERRATNLRHALELAHEAEGAGARSADRLLRWVRTRHTQTTSAGTAEMRLESDDHAVQVTTMHGCKGLQYRVVFAPFLWESREKDTWFGGGELRPPRPHVTGEDGGPGIVYDLGSPDVEHHRALADAERLAEQVRLTYVALTRAEDRAYVVWGPLSGAHASGLGHLLHGHAAAHDGCDGRFAKAAQTAARKALGGTVAALRSWIDTEGLADRMAVEALPDVAPFGPAMPATATPERLGDARRLSSDAAGRIGAVARRSSFSAWAAGAPRDEAGGDGPGRPDAADGDDAAPDGMAAFASGAQAGTCLHAVLQTALFHTPDAYL
ncbi:MAG TPA: UvrD-helicase domain-containing protein, partial [Rubricoccaceae bacterium]